MGVSEGSEPDSGVAKALGCFVEVSWCLLISLIVSLAHSLSYAVTVTVTQSQSRSHSRAVTVVHSLSHAVTVTVVQSQSRSHSRAVTVAQSCSHGACPNMFGAVRQSELRIEMDQSEQLDAIFRTSSRRSEELEQQQPPVSKAAGDQTGKFSLFLPNEPLKHEA